jgi:hypothetical protein
MPYNWLSRRVRFVSVPMRPGLGSQPIKARASVDDSPTAVARVRIEIPSARAETSAHVRSRSAWSSRHAARESPRQYPPLPPGRCDSLADRHPPGLPAALRKLDAVAVLTARLLPAPQKGPTAG